MLALGSVLQGAQDGQSHHPIVEILSSRRGQDIPFAGIPLNTEAITEAGASVITHSNGQLCIVYNYGVYNTDYMAIRYVYTDQARTTFTTVTIPITRYYILDSVSICQLASGNLCCITL